MLILSGLCCVSILFIMSLSCNYRQERPVRSKGIIFLAVFSIGCGFSFLSSTAFYSVAGYSTCFYRLSLSVLAWSFCNSSLIGRELLLAKIFNGEFRPSQKWWKLYQPTFYFFTFLFFAEMVCRLRSFYSFDNFYFLKIIIFFLTPTITTSAHYDFENEDFFTDCNYNSSLKKHVFIWTLLIALNAILPLLNIILGIWNYNIPHEYNSFTNLISFTFFQILLVTLLFNTPSFGVNQLIQQEYQGVLIFLYGFLSAFWYIVPTAASLTVHLLRKTKLIRRSLKKLDQLISSRRLCLISKLYGKGISLKAKEFEQIADVKYVDMEAGSLVKTLITDINYVLIYNL
jgi:hypothetical protein